MKSRRTFLSKVYSIGNDQKSAIRNTTNKLYTTGFFNQSLLQHCFYEPIMCILLPS